MLVYNYNNDLHRFKKLHDETGGKLKDFDFKYYDCFCGGEDYKIVSTATRHRNHFTVVQCTSCGTLRINPYLSDKSIETYYKEVYGPVKRGDVPAEGLFERQSKSSAALLKMLKPFLTSQEAKVLDYGSGAGGRMKAFKEAGYDVYIQDFDKKYMEYGLSQGLKPFSETKSYDMMILSHVLEHINHPVGFLKDIARLISDTGYIYIEVPLIENTRKKKTLLGDFHLAHKFYFTCESLTYLAHMAGFRKVADFHNAILITKGTNSVVEPLVKSVKKSEKCIVKASRKEAISKLKMGIKRPFKKKK
jgi:2-polyprenyl-3-methyl-5-hydroxy-6-metoxy-1,4-benzoquinol methylase